MNIALRSRVVAVCISAFVAASAVAQSTSRVSIDALTTSFGTNKVTPTFQFGHTIGATPITVDYSIVQDFSYCSNRPLVVPSDAIVDVALFEDGVKVDHHGVTCAGADQPPPNQHPILSYNPTVPGLKTLTVVATLNDGTQAVSNGVLVRMFGVALDTALGETVTPAFLPFTSRIFLRADALLADANIKLAQFFHRTLPFQLSAGVPYTSGDKVVFNGKLYQALTDQFYAPGSATANINSDPNQDVSSDPNYRYIGPRLVADLDYYNYREPTNPVVLLPDDYPAPPRGDSDLVIISNPQANGEDDVYEVNTAGRLVSNSPLTFSNDGGKSVTGVGVVQFTFAGSGLQPNHSYNGGELVVSNGRAYEVVQAGTTAGDVSVGLQQTTGNVASSGSAVFNYIPTKVLKSLLAYWQNDLVISNGNLYRVTVAGMTAPNSVGAGLTSTDASQPETKQGVVTFQKVGEPFNAVRNNGGTNAPPQPYETGSVFSANGRIYKATAASSPSPTPAPPAAAPPPGPTPSSTDPYAQESTVVQYVDNRPLANSNPAVVTYQTITTQLVVPQFHKYTEIDSDYAGTPLQQSVLYRSGDIVVSNGYLFEVTVGGTMGAVGNGLDPAKFVQTLGGLTFNLLGPFYKRLSTIHPLGDVPFPYSSFDYSYPYSLKWSPSETITNHYSAFGPAGYYEEHTNIELVTRISDSKDRTSTSATVPISILPPIDARAQLNVQITQPSNDRVVAAGAPVEITAEVRDINNVVRAVEAVQFFVDGVPIYAPDVTFPYTTQGPAHWTPTVAGTYILNAVAVDDKGNYSISPDVRVNVTGDQPFVRITTAGETTALSPLVLQSGETILIQGIASGSGGDPGRIASITILSDGNEIGTATAGSDGRFAFSFVPSNASQQPVNYQITARVLDLNGATANSNTIYLQILPGPIISPSATPSGSVTPTPTASPTATPTATPIVTGKLANISTRGPVGTGTDVMIAGFVLDGGFGKIIAIRGLGPSMAAFGVADSLQDPTLSLRDANGNEVLSNDDYYQASDDEQSILEAFGLTPTDSRESAMVVQINAGTYTCILQGKDTGTGLIEIYDLAADTNTRLLNLSTRGEVKPGDAGAMIGGFIIQGTTPQRVVIRAVGPSLKNAGVADALADPTLDLYRGSTRLLSNDNWKSTQQQEIEATGIAPTNDKESAIVTLLDPGTYSAVVRSNNNTSGVALAEVYQLNQ